MTNTALVYSQGLRGFLGSSNLGTPGASTLPEQVNLGIFFFRLTEFFLSYELRESAVPLKPVLGD